MEFHFDIFLKKIKQLHYRYTQEGDGKFCNFEKKSEKIVEGYYYTTEKYKKTRKREMVIFHLLGLLRVDD